MADPPPPPPARAPGLVPPRWTPLLAVLGVAAATAAIAWSPLHGDCGFRALTGAPCPGCGMTRAAEALAVGDAAQAWRWHPLLFPLLAAWGVVAAAALHEGLTGRPTFRRPADRFGVPLAVAGAVLFAAVWALRVFVRPEWSPDPIPLDSLAGRLLR